MGDRTPVTANYNHFSSDKSGTISSAPHSSLSDPERSANLQSLDEHRLLSDAEHGNGHLSHSGTSTDALLRSRDGRQTPCNSGHGNDIDTVTSVEVNSRTLAEASSPPANFSSCSVNERHYGQANDAYRSDPSDSNEALISVSTDPNNQY